MMLRTFATIALAVVSSQSAAPGVRNGGFEDAAGGPVPGWSVPAASTAAGYSARLTDEQPKSGARAALLVRDLEGKAPGFGNLMQAIDAAPFRDRRVILRAFVRTAPGSRAQLWLRVDRPGGVVSSTTWGTARSFPRPGRNTGFKQTSNTTRRSSRSA